MGDAVPCLHVARGGCMVCSVVTGSMEGEMFRRRLVVVRRPRLLGAALLGGAGFLIGRRRGGQAVPEAEPVDRLSELARLHDDGSLTDEEYSQAKREVLGS